MAAVLRVVEHAAHGSESTIYLRNESDYASLGRVPWVPVGNFQNGGEREIRGLVGPIECVTCRAGPILTTDRL